MFWSSRKQTELSVDNEHVVVHPTAEIGADVSIGPFTYIGPNCRVGDGCNLHNNVSLLANTVLGENNEIYPGAVIGADPQDKKFEGEDSWVLIGDGNIVRECVTWGSPKTALDKLVAFRDHVGPFETLLLTGADWGGPNEVWERQSMRLMAEEVMPKFNQHVSTTKVPA